VIYGRSDSTINRGGIRIGTGELYRAVAGLDEVVDALAIDIPRPGTEGWLDLYVVLREGLELDASLADKIRRRIRDSCSPRHVPDEIQAVPDVPRTLSGKLLEVPVKRIMMGSDPSSVAARDSLANPAAFDWFVSHARQRRVQAPR
jgi:acetoacetyl-CoA synthetase